MGAAGILGLLLVWWGITAPLFPTTTMRATVRGSGVFETVPDPKGGPPVRIEKLERIETPVTEHRALVNPPALDTPMNTLRDAGRLLFRKEPSLLEHALRSTLRILAGFALAAAVGVPLGVAMGLFARLRAAAAPLLSFLRPLPSISWVPLALIWLGAGESQKLAILFMGCFSAAVLYTLDATLKVDPSLLRAARNLGAKESQILWRVLLPAALPHILSGLKVVLAIAWTCVISAEIVGTTVGLGALIWTSKETSHTAAVLVGMATISIVVLGMDALFAALERRLLPWMAEGERR
jgi:taurine transport system permease protein